MHRRTCENRNANLKIINKKLLRKLLNSEGEKGWELVLGVPGSDVFCFKRPLR